MYQKLADLIKVKSIVTLTVFGVFSYLAIAGKVDAKDFMVVLGMIATYYFTKKDNKIEV